METKTELKTIHDLPEKMKEMYDITDSHECIGDPATKTLLFLSKRTYRQQCPPSRKIPNRCAHGSSFPKVVDWFQNTFRWSDNP